MMSVTLVGPRAVRRPGAGLLRFARRNPELVFGLALAAALALFAFAGPLLWDIGNADPLSAAPSRPPSFEHPFGTDSQGRDLLATAMLGTWLTIKVGLIAGGIGVALGALLGFLGAYYGGWLDTIIVGVVDVGLTIPALLFLVVAGSAFHDGLDTTSIAFMIGALAWLSPTRQIRAQALVMRQAGYVQLAQLNGVGGLGIILLEMMPNLMPYLMASFVLAVSQAILAAVGLDALGLGPMDEPTLGMTIYWMLANSAFIRGWWWWVMTPIAVLVVLFVALYLISIGLDVIANPRLRRRTGL
jgi:peptide/nickel transport system permease protein